MIRLRNASACNRRGGLIFHDVDLTVPRGAVGVVTGHAGSGKSALIDVCRGILPLTSGTLDLGADARSAAVTQNYELCESLTVIENLLLPQIASGASHAQARQRANEALSQLGVDTVGDHLIGEVSGGQRQRAAVARALVDAPSIVLADEPTSALDAENRALVLTALRRAADHGATVLITTNDTQLTEGADITCDLGSTG